MSSTASIWPSRITTGELTSAARVQFQGASWQRCHVHLSANVSGAAPKAVQDELHARGRAIFGAPHLQTARTLLAQLVADYAQQAPTAIAMLERGFDDATAVLALPRRYRQRLRTANGVERPEQGSAPARACHPHLPQSGFRHPVARSLLDGAR